MTSRSVASRAALIGVFALTVWVAVTASHAISSTRYFGGKLVVALPPGV
ncbi:MULTISPECIES: hypothetical protein [unclassified Mesorhizobium]|nr:MULTISPECIES: hypothetical protein [unclassified Mesorhizobium]ESX32814.1 hypothetical protein X765_01065 [Mesorhizobium sp. LSHC440B00]ESX33824.1 hypothetical protein X764_29260 [Mesorhizobium sp. LSHC440A00]ESX40119.1 hypothetical protein X763_07345 [Mesorhizobium sp. LSHC432A00]ESZ37801.1 hypothetical protein X731_29355 [Mesorhizobium sp. L2C054A000]WJI55465.1 hypothetical protein NLY33_19825 [Mesorhizobium sp. C432A]